jgi:hypothetical protein
MKGICFSCTAPRCTKGKTQKRKGATKCKPNEQNCIFGKEVPTRCITYSWRTPKSGGPYKHNGAAVVSLCKATSR